MIKNASFDVTVDLYRERLRQRMDEKWNDEHDDEHVNGEIARAAAVYALPDGIRRWFIGLWPWDLSWLKEKHDRRRQLVIAGALIIAEIERFDRAKEKTADANR